jgi:hypothetical protein
MAAQPATKCLRNGGVTCKFKVLSSFNVCPRGQWRLRKPTTAQTQTLAVICPGQFGQSNGGHSNNRDFPRGQLTDFEHFIKNYERVETTWTNLEPF